MKNSSTPLTVIFRLVGVILLFPLLLGLLSRQAQAEKTAVSNWAYPDRDYRLGISVGADGYGRNDKVIETDIDFAAKLTGQGATGAFDESSLRVTEIDAGGNVINSDVPFQFDNGPTRNTPQGTLLFLLDGSTGASDTRIFHVYYDTTGTFSTPASFTDRVQMVDDNLSFRGQSSYAIQTLDADTTVNTVYFYHKTGGGFASIRDRNNRDWISYKATSGSESAGEYRGIPNMGDAFHPGYSNNNTPNMGSDTTLLEDGPLRISYQSVSKNGSWTVRWDIYPTYARMTVLDVPNEGKYWFLYEGTPGGNLDNTGTDQDVVVRSDGQIHKVSQTWAQGIQELSPEWVYFDDIENDDRIFFVAHSIDDSLPDSYRDQQDVVQTGNDKGGMTVFGFGRSPQTGTTKHLSAEGAMFTIGFGEDDTFAAAAALIEGNTRPLLIEVDNEPPSLTQNSPLTVTEGETAVFGPTHLNSTDPEDDPVTFTLNSIPAHGTLYRNTTPLTNSDSFTQADINGGLISYQHDGSESTSDSFQFVIADLINVGEPETFTLLIDGVNDAPVGVADSRTVAAGTPTKLDVLANDTDADSGTLSVVELTQPTHGTVLLNGDGTVTYTAVKTYAGPDSFSYRASDGAQQSAVTLVNITVIERQFIFLPLLENQ